MQNLETTQFFRLCPPHNSSSMIGFPRLLFAINQNSSPIYSINPYLIVGRKQQSSVGDPFVVQFNRKQVQALLQNNSLNLHLITGRAKCCQNRSSRGKKKRAFTPPRLGQRPRSPLMLVTLSAPRAFDALGFLKLWSQLSTPQKHNRTDYILAQQRSYSRSSSSFGGG